MIYVIYVIFANKRGIYDHKKICCMNILAHTKTRLCDKLRHCEKYKNGYVYYYRAVKTLFSRGQNGPNLHFSSLFVTRGKFLHFDEISSFSVSDEFLRACIEDLANKIVI